MAHGTYYFVDGHRVSHLEYAAAVAGYNARRDPGTILSAPACETWTVELLDARLRELARALLAADGEDYICTVHAIRRHAHLREQVMFA